MAPRTYNVESRRRQQAERRSRIAAATAELHAARGVGATSYADIAERAGVSLPTVYSHFPDQDELLSACTGHVAGQAPALPVAEILAAGGLPAAVDLLVAAHEKQHLHFEPWLAKREDGVIPFLAALSASAREERAALVAAVLDRHLGAGDHRETIAAWETLLSFDTWHRMVRGHRLPRAAVRRLLAQCLLNLARPAAPPARPTRKRKQS